MDFWGPITPPYWPVWKMQSFPKYASSIIGFWLRYGKILVPYVRSSVRFRGVPPMKKHLHFEKWPSKTRWFLILFAKTSRGIVTFEAKCLKTQWKIDVFLWNCNKHCGKSSLLRKNRWKLLKIDEKPMKTNEKPMKTNEKPRSNNFLFYPQRGHKKE